MFIRRDLDGFLSKRMFGGKVLVVYGPRQAGKTTAIDQYLSQTSFANEVVRFDGAVCIGIAPDRYAEYLA